MANPEHLEILKQGVKVWNQWREENPGVQPDLSKADLTKESFMRSNPRVASLTKLEVLREIATGDHLRGANLSGANLGGANLTGADLRDVNLIGSYLNSANLSGANLTRADLGKVQLVGSNLLRATFREAHFKDTVLYGTLFIDANLTGAQGLNRCFHYGRSTLDHRTLAKSGLLPEAFLRGCGLSDLEIMSARLLYADLTPGEITDIGYEIIRLRSDPSIQYYSCFISYSHQDKDFARRLHDSLQNTGIRCWLDERQLLPLHGQAVSREVEFGTARESGKEQERGRGEHGVLVVLGAGGARSFVHGLPRAGSAPRPPAKPSARKTGVRPASRRSLNL